MQTLGCAQNTKLLTDLLHSSHVQVPECIINLQTEKLTTHFTQLQMIPNVQTKNPSNQIKQDMSLMYRPCHYVLS